MKVLVASPSPRDIKEFKPSLLKLPYDIYMAKYYWRIEAYARMRRFFLSHDYDAIAVIPDDLIVHKEGLQLLIEDIENNKNAIISGICNFDAGSNKNKYCFRREGSGYYPEIDKLDEYLEKATSVDGSPYIYKVEFNGFACCLLPRHIVETFPFTFDIHQANVDQRMADTCRANGIDVLVDIRARFLHLADRLGYYENFYVGKRKPKELFIPC